MIDIIIKGTIAKKTDILSFAFDIMQYYLPRDKQCTIDIYFSNKLDEYYGLCMGDENEVEIEIAKINPVTGNRFTLNEMMLNLAHELVHAKQYLLGELPPDHGPKPIPPYRHQPWEREAYKSEEFLYNRYWKDL